MEKVKQVSNIRLNNYNQKQDDNKISKKQEESSFDFDELLNGELKKLEDTDYFNQQKQKLR